MGDGVQGSKLRRQHEDKPGLVGWVLFPCISIKVLKLNHALKNEKWFNAFLDYREVKEI